MPAHSRSMRRTRTSCSRRNDGPGGGSRSGAAASLRGRRGRTGWRSPSVSGSVSGASSTSSSSALTSGSPRRPHRPLRRRRFRRVAFDGRLGDERVGFRLQVGDLGFEGETQHLAAHLGVGRGEAPVSAARQRVVGILAADQGQEPAALARDGRLGAHDRGCVDGPSDPEEPGRSRMRRSARLRRRGRYRDRRYTSPSTTGRRNPPARSPHSSHVDHGRNATARSYRRNTPSVRGGWSTGLGVGACRPRRIAQLAQAARKPLLLLPLDRRRRLRRDVVHDPVDARHFVDDAATGPPEHLGHGSFAQSAVIPSSDVTARIATTFA